jgi:uncharacterized damage-inducible protein DinB
MTMHAAPSHNEAVMLVNFLNQQRNAVRNAAYGLTDAQAAAPTTGSSLSVGGLIKHLTFVERGWAADIAGAPRPANDIAGYLDGLTMRPGETIDSLLAAYAEVAAATDAAIAAADLDHEVPVPDAPWFPKDIDTWSVRWIVLHLIEETARHAGHADIVRESLDGATSGPLLAAAEGLPGNDWLQPWRPAAREVTPA